MNESNNSVLMDIEQNKKLISLDNHGLQTDRPTQGLFQAIALGVVMVVVGLLSGCALFLEHPTPDQIRYEYHNPAWTPDGKIVTMRWKITSYKQGSGGSYGDEQHHLVVMDADGSNEREIKEVETSARFISVSPSNNLIAYAIDNYVNIIDWNGNLADYFRSGYTHFFVPQNLGWSLDGRKIAYNELNKISLYDLDTKATSNIVATHWGDFDWNNNKIAYIYRPSDISDKYLAFVNSDGSSDTVTTVNLNLRAAPRYATTSNVVILGNENLLNYDLNTGITIVVTTNVDYDADQIDINNNKIIYSNSDKYLFYINLDGSGYQQIR